MSSDNLCKICKSELDNDQIPTQDLRFGIKETFYYRNCKNCKVAQIYPNISDLKLKSYYEKYYNSTEKKDGSRYLLIRSLIEKLGIIKLINFIDGDISFHLRKGTGCLLEIGCNEGRNLDFFAKNGFEVEGLEINNSAAKIAKKLGYKIHNCYVGQLSKIKKYDVIVLANVLEHDNNPSNLLKTINLLLKPNGQLWISLPNYESIWKKIFGSLWINWHPPFHISHFNIASLETLCLVNGLKACNIKTVSPGLWFSMSALSFLYFKPGDVNTKLRKPIFLIIFMTFFYVFLVPVKFLVDKRKKGDCIKGIFQKCYEKN